MKLLAFLLFLFLQIISNAQVVRIPDANFKQRIISLGYDINGDNQIQVSEAQQETILTVDKLGIVNMEGVNSFTNLEELNCYDNKITSLDVSKLKKLKYLYAFNNRIGNLNIYGLTQLEHLYIQSIFLLVLLMFQNAQNLLS